MSKFPKLKQWRTIPEAAKYLTTALGEDICAADILQLGLEGQLKLSVHLISDTLVDSAEFVTEAKTDYDLFLTGCNKRIKLSDKKIQINGIFDLSMIGGERADILHALALETGGQHINLDPDKEALDNPVILEGQDGNKFCLYENMFSKVPDSLNKFVGIGMAYHLPKDSILIVRTNELDNLIQSLSSKEPSEKAYSTREREKVSTLIIALVKLAELKLEKPYAAAESINAALAGTDLSISEGTVNKYFKEASNYKSRETTE